MILGLEIALAVYGFFGLITGSLIVSKSKVVRGTRARLLGLLALVPVVAAFVLIFTFTGSSRTLDFVEGGIVGAVAVLVFGIGYFLGVPADEEPTEAEPEAEDEPETDAEQSAVDPDATEADIDVSKAGAPAAATEAPSADADMVHVRYFDSIADCLEALDIKPTAGPPTARAEASPPASPPPAPNPSRPEPTSSS
jgi:hypothetical protein